MEVTYQFSAQGLSTWFIAGCYVLFFIIAVIRVNYLAVLRDPGEQTRLIIAFLVVVALWQINAPISHEMLNVHFLGVTVLTLMFDFPMAVLVGSLAVLFNASDNFYLSSFILNVLCLVIVPAGVTSLVLKVEKKAGITLFFSYIYLCGFFGAALAIAASIGASALVWFCLDGALFELAIWPTAQYTPLFMLSEAVINGMVIAGLVVFSPHAISTLDEQRYAGH